MCVPAEVVAAAQHVALALVGDVAGVARVVGGVVGRAEALEDLPGELAGVGDARASCTPAA